MSWVKRNELRDAEAEKRRWGKSGMSWVKRQPEYDNRVNYYFNKNNDNDNNNYYYNDDDNPGMDEPPVKPAKRRWEKSGVSWIKRGK